MDYAGKFVEENQAFSEIFRDVDESTPVPTCPGWTLRHLFRHVGRGDRWAAQIVSDRLDGYLDPRAVEGGKPPPDPAGAIAWLHGGAQRLIDAVELTGVQTPVWTFLGSRPANWWVRRRLHEVAVHRADAAFALGGDFTLEPAVAADGITEWLERVAIQSDGKEMPLPLEEGDTLHLHATDPGLGEDGEWTIAVEQGRITWSHRHGKGSAALRGPATGLLLAMLRRRPPAETDAELFGDDAVWQRWLDRTPL
ncbi:maleylpyruvate isomerase family mycothiol-dependent enzyme [Mycobacterium sp. 94-17]|uniref:maleylpyruvate isomerase family mycothiol-dependent enzyme n=1 Tax=Mycobacterium sp. 94-17 TaxID=2986147 RepID=UPI002D1EEF59|nr:maleylpyruvate isomerase family mycothiol-dependent enzyme [Mycobacterium sp. 94-17]MEB4208426.1 maleylpyruvate isomerase family mycothiol-dependent enzyme [Mycobacterium sp. 94-17]